MKLATAEEMKKLDNMAIESGIEDIVLMENAAIKSFYEIQKTINVKGKNAIVFCGVGNNGGDGFAIARHLYNSNAHVFIYMLIEEKKLKGSPKTNFNIVKALNIQYKFVYSKTDFNKYMIENCDIIIDAIFGTGLSRNVEGLFEDAISLINSSRALKVSVDVPSGVNASTGEIMNAAVKANLTPTFALAKPCHFLYPAREYAGHVQVVDISTPKDSIDKFEPSFFAIEKKDIILKERPATSHKGYYGHIAIVGGSVGKSGAVIMSSLSAIRSGSGLVSACIPNSINFAFESSVLEAMSFILDDKDGYISSSAIEKLLDFIKDKDAIAFGMGLGMNKDTKEITKSIISTNKPLLIDADGLNNLSNNLDLLKFRNYPTIITPHPKEFARLINKTTSNVIRNRINLIRDFAREFNTIVVLKMADTLITSPDGIIYINTSGNPGLATGGSGDVLSGIITSLLGQGYSPKDAAITGVFLHGYAADLALQNTCYESLLPSDVINHIKNAIREIRN